MNQQEFSKPITSKRIHVQDEFWNRRIHLVCDEMIPYQWKALNDEIPDAAKSYCMRNFKIAGKVVAAGGNKKTYPTDILETLPESEEQMEDRFYGFFFQDSDFYKWIEAVAYSLEKVPNKELEQIADAAIDLVCAAQLENGYLDTYYIINDQSKIFSDLQDNHELYCLGHLTEGAVAYYQATGKDKLLNAAKKYADFASSRLGLGEGKKPGYPGHEIAEMALVRLYEITGDDKYLELSRFFVNQRGCKPFYFDEEENSDWAGYEYYQSHLPVREQTEAVGHAVRATYLYSGMADVARLTSDSQLYQSCMRLFESIVSQKMYVTGGIGATNVGEAFSYPYDLKNDEAYAETCASIGMVFFARRLLQIHADSRIGDILEREVYNGTISGMALDGKSFFYVNPLEVLPQACECDKRISHVKPQRQKWFGCACCPPNLARMITSIDDYAFTENADTLWVHLYMGASIKKMIGMETVQIQITSHFPDDGLVNFQIKGTAEFTISLRIPEWGREYELTGCENAKIREEDGYLYITKAWSGEETFSIDFPMTIRALKANPLVRADAYKVALQRGPVVYCMEEVDNSKNLCLYELDVEGEYTCTYGKIENQSMMFIQGEGRKIVPWDADALYREDDEEIYEKAELKFIPYYAWANRGLGEMQVWVRKEID